MSACKDCEHLHVDYSGTESIMGYEPSEKPIWYMLYCTASPRPLSFDPFSGTKKSFERNGHEGYHHVRDINKGDCPKFHFGKNNKK